LINSKPTLDAHWPKLLCVGEPQKRNVLGPEKLGGVRVTPKTITFNLIDTFASDALSRVTFSNISASHFTWSEDKSLDQGKT